MDYTIVELSVLAFVLFCILPIPIIKFVYDSGKKTDAAESTHTDNRRMNRIREKHPSAYKYWTARDDSALIKLYHDGKTRKELSVLFGRSINAIDFRLVKLGLMDEKSIRQPEKVLNLKTGAIETPIPDVTWNRIEKLNKRIGVTRWNCWVDEHGYLRWNATNNLVHRDVAFNEIYKKSGGNYPNSFSCYEVHHINHDKFDCNPENLQILTPNEHDKQHGK